MEDKIEIRKIGNIDVYFRKKNQPLTNKSQQAELEHMVKYLTNEEFIDSDGKYKRQLIHPEKFELIDKYIEEKVSLYICLCSEDTCNHLVIIKHIPTGVYFTVGSICYLRFDENNVADLYNKVKAKRCNDCNNPLVYKECKYKKNTDKKCNNICYKCIGIREEEEKNKMEELEELMSLSKIHENKEERIYIFVKYDHKDDAKSMGAKWDVDNKRWYSPHKELTTLLKKYKPYPLKIL
jgi:hypothetical protein